MAKRLQPKPAERFDGERFEDELLDPYDSYEGRLEAFLDRRDAVVEAHLRARP